VSVPLPQAEFCVAKGYKADCEVIYGDTDSVMVNFKVITSHERGGLVELAGGVSCALVSCSECLWRGVGHQHVHDRVVSNPSKKWYHILGSQAQNQTC
jgi:hypothetical protein